MVKVPSTSHRISRCGISMARGSQHRLLHDNSRDPALRLGSVLAASVSKVPPTGTVGPSSTGGESAPAPREERHVKIERELQVWSERFAQRARGDVGDGIAAVLGLSGAKDLISFGGGFP